MSRRHVKPSAYLPSHLQLDLNAGTESEHPMLASLDETLESWCMASQQQSLTISPLHLPVLAKRQVLEGHGFSISELPDPAIDLFFAQLTTLFTHTGTLHAVKLLADIFFPGLITGVQRGRHFARVSRHGSLSFPITAIDRDDPDRLVVVKLADDLTSDQQADCLKKWPAFAIGASLLVPDGYSVLLQSPRLAEKPDPGRFDLSRGARLETRRL